LWEQEKAAEVLRKVATFLRGLTEDEIDDLLAGRTRLTLVGRSTRKPVSRTSVTPELDVDALRRELTAKATREEGMSLLNSLSPTRETLRQIASAIDIPAPKTDTVERLKERIIEATIGYRLRSQAIRNSD
jgi:hypothetical protein